MTTVLRSLCSAGEKIHALLDMGITLAMVLDCLYIWYMAGKEQ